MSDPIQQEEEEETSLDKSKDLNLVICENDNLLNMLEIHLKKERLTLGLDTEEPEDNYKESRSVESILNRENEIKIDSSNKRLELYNAILQVDECIKVIKHQMDTLLDTEYQMCSLKNELLKRKERSTNFFHETRNDKDNMWVENELKDNWNNFKAPYFKDSFLFASPRNKDSLEFIKTESSKQFCPWSNFDVKLLQKSVRKNIIQTYLSGVNQNHKDISQVDFDTKLECLKTVNYFNTEPLSNIINPNMEANLDWMTVSELMNYRFTANECKKMWHLYAKPLVNKSKWAKDEVAKLKQIIEMNENQNWNDTAEQLNTSRSGYQCFLFYLKFIYKRNSGPWSKAEIEMLKNAVTSSTYGHKICWNKVVYYVESRSGKQIFQKWTYVINPTIKKGQFKRSEDQLLMTLVHEFNMNFDDISKVLKNRTVHQLRNHYITSVNPPSTYQFGEWSESEDRQLLALVDELGTSSWSGIAKRMKTRNRIQVRHRYACLLKKMDSNAGLELSTIKRYKRMPSKKLRINNKIFLSKLKVNKKRNKVLKLNDLNKVINKCCPKKLKASDRVDLELVKFFSKSVNHDTFKMSEEDTSNVLSGNAKTELVNILSIMKADLKFEDKKINFLKQCAEQNLLGENGLQTVNLLEQTVLTSRKYDVNNSNSKSLNLLPPNFNTLVSLWQIFSMLRKSPKKEYNITFNKKNIKNDDEALMNWHRRLHTLFLWPSFLSKKHVGIME